MAGIVNPIIPGLNAAFGDSPSGFVGGILKFAVNAALIISAVAFVFMFILGGIQWITSGSDKAALEGARKRILNSLTGVVIVFMVFAIVKFVETVFGVQILQFDFASLVITST